MEGLMSENKSSGRQPYNFLVNDEADECLCICGAGFKSFVTITVEHLGGRHVLAAPEGNRCESCGRRVSDLRAFFPTKIAAVAHIQQLSCRLNTRDPTLKLRLVDYRTIEFGADALT
jgi:hypothetical protein